VDALAERVLAINPYCRVKREANFLDESNCAALLSPDEESVVVGGSTATTTTNGATVPPFDCVIDCLDDFGHKAEVIAHCKSRGLPVVSTVGGK
jgi:tRNA A37 threonylcarbamoyladenosine dehydratase